MRGKKGQGDGDQRGSSLFLEVGGGHKTTTTLGQLDLPPFVALSFVDDDDQSTSLHPELLWVLGRKVVHRYRLAHLRHYFPHDPRSPHFTTPQHIPHHSLIVRPFDLLWKKKKKGRKKSNQRRIDRDLLLLLGLGSGLVQHFDLVQHLGLEGIHLLER